MRDYETLWGGLTMRRADGAFALGTDSVLLADFVRLPARARVCDLGCGSGAIGLLLCGKHPSCQITGVELLESACDLAHENITVNTLGHRFAILQGDLREIRALLPANSFTHVVSNPPYFTVSQPSAPTAARAAARAEHHCTIKELCAAASWLLTYGGTCSLVYRPERLCDLFCALREAGLEAKRIRFVRHRPDAPVSLVLVEARLGGKPNLHYEPDLILHEPDGRQSSEFERIYYHLKE